MSNDKLEPDQWEVVNGVKDMMTELCKIVKAEDDPEVVKNVVIRNLGIGVEMLKGLL